MCFVKFLGIDRGRIYHEKWIWISFDMSLATMFSGTRLVPEEEYVFQETADSARRWLCIQGVPEHDRSHVELKFDAPIGRMATHAQLCVFKASALGTGGFCVSVKDSYEENMIPCGQGRFGNIEDEDNCADLPEAEGAWVRNIVLLTRLHFTILGVHPAENTCY